MSLNMMLRGGRAQTFALGFSLQPPETRAGLIGEGVPVLLWKKGLVTKEKKLGEADSVPD